MSDVSNRPNRTWFVLLRNQMTIITQFKSLHNFQGILTSSNQLPPDLTSVEFSEQGYTDRYRLDQVEITACKDFKYFWEWFFQKLKFQRPKYAYLLFYDHKLSCNLAYYKIQEIIMVSYYSVAIY